MERKGLGGILHGHRAMARRDGISRQMRYDTVCTVSRPILLTSLVTALFSAPIAEEVKSTASGVHACSVAHGRSGEWARATGMYVLHGTVAGVGWYGGVCECVWSAECWRGDRWLAGREQIRPADRPPW